MTGTIPAFDSYIAVDWSARNKPSPERPARDAVWVGVAEGEEHYFRTRRAAIDALRDRLQEAVAAGQRALVGWDFGFGYPAGFAASVVGSADADWSAVWELLRESVLDETDNRNNRFEIAARLNELCGASGDRCGPFWGCPSGRVHEFLRPTGSSYPFRTGNGYELCRVRWTELREPRVQPVWKLFGAGSVGGQTLLGIPAVAELRSDPLLADCSRVWPFETGFSYRSGRPGSAAILHVEIWPSMLREAMEQSPIPDQAQVRVMARWMQRADASGLLGELLRPPEGLSAEQITQCLREEGWVFGSGISREKLLQVLRG